MDIHPTNPIRAARQRRGLTQQQVADKLGVTKATVSGWECGYNDPAPRAAIALTKILRGLKFEHIYPARNDEQGRAAA
jgi:transcriptional regulator with XRE-family HTH domain